MLFLHDHFAILRYQLMVLIELWKILTSLTSSGFLQKSIYSMKSWMKETLPSSATEALSVDGDRGGHVIGLYDKLN